MGAASPDLEKQGIFAVVFVNREYSGQPVRRGENAHKKIRSFLNGFYIFKPSVLCEKT